MKTRLLFVLIFVLLTGCCQSPERESPFVTVANDDWIGTVRRVVDQEAGVACWVYARAGISCLPLSQTTLDLPLN